jgi:uncharacterized membrane protein YraQ (UPF0718 family)
MKWFVKEELKGSLEATWGFPKQILPLLLAALSVWAIILIDRQARNSYTAFHKKQVLIKKQDP